LWAGWIMHMKAPLSCCFLTRFTFSFSYSCKSLFIFSVFAISRFYLVLFWWVLAAFIKACSYFEKCSFGERIILAPLLLRFCFIYFCLTAQNGDTELFCLRWASKLGSYFSTVLVEASFSRSNAGSLFLAFLLYIFLVLVVVPLVILAWYASLRSCNSFSYIISYSSWIFLRMFKTALFSFAICLS